MPKAKSRLLTGAEKVHAEEMVKQRRGMTLSEVLRKMTDDGYYHPHQVRDRMGTLWLALCDPNGIWHDDIAITAIEAQRFGPILYRSPGDICTDGPFCWVYRPAPRTRGELEGRT
jgi:hypothetical protein